MNPVRLREILHNITARLTALELTSDVNVIKIDTHIMANYEQGRADEREACAELCDNLAKLCYDEGGSAKDCSHKIRERDDK